MSKIGGDFGRYSAGLGSLERASPYGGSGLLRSNISSPSSFTLRPRSTAAARLPGLPGFSTPRGQTYAPVTAKLTAPRYPVRGSALDQLDPGGGGLGYYLRVMGHDSRSLADSDQPITSFVPTEPSLFQDKMAKGDRFFRSKRYAKAHAAYKIALIMARESPEVHLSLVHSSFALEQYYLAAQHLRQTLKRLPELPMVRLNIRSFYDKKKDPAAAKTTTPTTQPENPFLGHLQKLKTRVQSNENDPDVLLVLAYAYYFDGRDSEAAQALRDSYTLSSRGKREANIRAIETFWEGMAGMGKVEEKGLASTTRPAYLLPAPETPEPEEKPGESTDQGQPKVSSPPTDAKKE